MRDVVKSNRLTLRNAALCDVLMKQKFSFTCLLYLPLLLLPVLSRPAYAQNPRGTLRGVIQDTSGRVVPSAVITVQARNLSLSRTTTSDSNGKFRLDELLPSSYHFIVNARGFAEAASDVAVSVSSVRDVTVTLRPKAVEQILQVQGRPESISAQPIDVASTVRQGVVTSEDLENIPLGNRSFANIAYLVPGTEPVEPSDPTKARITAISFGGSSGLNVELSVDGGDNSDDYIGGFLQNFSPDAIDEFAVRTSQEEADTGRTVGGSVVITTKHGTNQWHGGGAFYERASGLTARYPIDNPVPDPKQSFSRQNYVGTLGGPVFKNRLWIFSSFEHVHENASVAYSPASRAQFAALSSLASMGLIDGISSIAVPASVPVSFRDYLGSLRFDWAQSQKSQWFLRSASDTYTTNNDLVQQATLPSTGATSGSHYFNSVLSNTHTFSPIWLGTLTFDASLLHHTESRNSKLGFAVEFPFSATFQTISGLETFGDNQFATPITAFPVLRDQEKYQFRYDVARASGAHSLKIGVGFIHEPVLSGALSGTAETLISYVNNPDFYTANLAQFYFSPECQLQPVPADAACTFTPASDGSFSQNVQRFGMYAQDSWRATRRLTINYGMRYDTTFGLFDASGRTQLQNPALLTLKALRIPLVNGAPHDYRLAFGPRLGFAYALGPNQSTIFRAAIGKYYNDLAQNGWVNALQAVNTSRASCVHPGDSGCIPGGGQGSMIDPKYKTPYALHASAGVEHAFNNEWTLSADWVHEQGVHAYRAYSYTAGYTLFSPDPTLQPLVPNVTVYKTSNRSNYDAFSIHLQGNVTGRVNLVANYTLATAKTWGCIVGELFDYVNGVCNPLNAFGPGDYGPSGEDVRHRFVLAGTVQVPGGVNVSTLTQAETARPFTLTTGVDVNGFGDPGNNRAVVNGVQTTLDQFRGTPYAQVDLRIDRPIHFSDRVTMMPFVEFFNLFDRSNPANNYVADIGALSVPPSEVASGNVTHICADPSCNTLTPITNLNQLKKPAGALGDFFGPGTTVGIPFAAQLGVRVQF